MTPTETSVRRRLGGAKAKVEEVEKDLDRARDRRNRAIAAAGDLPPEERLSASEVGRLAGVSHVYVLRLWNSTD